MCHLKQHISEWLQIDKKQLQDIYLEDVQLLHNAQQGIRMIIDEMLVDYYPARPPCGPMPGVNPDLPCRGYWVEGTKELVIHIAIHNLSRTIVIPQDGWMIREDITIN